MTTIAPGDLVTALAIGLLVGGVVVSGFNAQQKSNPATRKALQNRMGALYTPAMFMSGGSPTAAMWLVASLGGAPTPLDTILVIVLIGLGMIATFTLLGNIVKLLGEYRSSGSHAGSL